MQIRAKNCSFRARFGRPPSPRPRLKADNPHSSVIRPTFVGAAARFSLCAGAATIKETIA
ncbi:hypothetical protein A1351_21460 [Methylosinus sp. R-45379]|nr:hypothetical protein A1351_21460 [Methylosinus sp. R-45379]